MDNNHNKDMALDHSKKILCCNMLNYHKCNYAHKCMYAHSLLEQKVKPIRHKVYTMIKKTPDLSGVNLVADPKLCETLLLLTKVCQACSNGKCPGGYNCRHGAINIKNRICYEDFMWGECKKRPTCPSIHLTDRGLKPYNEQKPYSEQKPHNEYKPYNEHRSFSENKPYNEQWSKPRCYNNYNSLSQESESVNKEIIVPINEVDDDIKKDIEQDEDIRKDIEQDEDIEGEKENDQACIKFLESKIEKKPKDEDKFQKYNYTKKRNLENNKPKEKKKKPIDLSNISGILLTKDYVDKHFNDGKSDVEIVDSEDEENVDQIIAYLNQESDSEDESIFTDMKKARNI